MLQNALNMDGISNNSSISPLIAHSKSPVKNVIEMEDDDFSEDALSISSIHDNSHSILQPPQINNRSNRNTRQSSQLTLKLRHKLSQLQRMNTYDAKLDKARHRINNESSFEAKSSLNIPKNETKLDSKLVRDINTN